jgi:hypothetical protein
MEVPTRIAGTADFFFRDELVPTNSGKKMFAISGTLKHEVFSRLSNQLSRKPESFRELVVSCQGLLKYLARDTYLLVFCAFTEKEWTQEVKALLLCTCRQTGIHVLLTNQGKLFAVEKMSPLMSERFGSALPPQRILEVSHAFGEGLPDPLPEIRLDDAIATIVAELEEIVADKVKILLKLTFVDAFMNRKESQKFSVVDFSQQRAYLIGSVPAVAQDEQLFASGVYLAKTAVECLLEGLKEQPEEFRDLTANVKSIAEFLATDTYGFMYSGGVRKVVKVFQLCEGRDGKELFLTKGCSMPIVLDKVSVLDHFADGMSEQYPDFKLADAFSVVEKRIVTAIEEKTKALGVINASMNLIRENWRGGKQS